MNYCNKCQEPTTNTKSAVIDGVYYRHICDNCATNGHVPLDGKYNREREREQFSKELIQPYDEKGNINREFAQAYPDKAEEMFGKERLKDI